MDTRKLEEETINKIEEKFKEYCINNDVKYKSKKYYKQQHAYFIGTINVFIEYIGNDFIIPPKWGIALMSAREIIEKY